MKLKLQDATLAAAILSFSAISFAQESNDPVFQLEDFSVTNLAELASRAEFGVTPVSSSELGKDDLNDYLGSQDLPLALNDTPSVFATDQGGGSGDSRINVRGFNQRNVAVMINGVPVNDMENGWVYWSNWDGIGDAASSIQLQRGTSNLNLAVPSIGGTLNILTSPASQTMGGTFKQEFGEDGFQKTTLVGHTGLINNKFAASGSIVRKLDGSHIDGVWADAWAWYVGATYKINELNTVEVYGFGAPQRHGQNLYERNIATYDESFARGLKNFDEEAIDTFYERGYSYNETWNYVDSSYEEKQYDSSGRINRKFSDYINERENFYDKPQASINWYFDPDNNWKWDNILYYSGGTGGGTGTYGSVARVDDPGGYFNRNRDWNAEIAENAANIQADGRAESTGILRNSRNNQDTIGAISKVSYDSEGNWKISAGLDWRTAEIEHYREVRDLLGGDYYTWNGREVGLGDKFNYNNTNTVDWLGAFVQGQYETDKFTSFAMLGLSQISYSYEDFFRQNTDGSNYTIDSETLDGSQFKFGGRYFISDVLSVYGNLGFVEKVPIFDAVIDDNSGDLYIDPKNEKFTNYEIGLNYQNEEGTLLGTVNFYNTKWKDRTFTRTVEVGDTTDLVSLTGVNQTHTGLEIEGTYYFTKELSLDASITLSDWTYDDDVSAIYRPSDRSAENIDFKLYIADLKVGEAPQTQYNLGLTYRPTSGLSINGRMRHNQDFYADFDPLSRTDENDRTQSWKTPDHTVFDLHINYDLPFDGKIRYKVFAHWFNVFDEKYIQDATDNDRWSGYSADFDASGDYADLHDADSAAVHFGTPSNVNFGLSATF